MTKRAKAEKAGKAEKTEKTRATLREASTRALEALELAQQNHDEIRVLQKQRCCTCDEARKATQWINANGQPRLDAIAQEIAKARREIHEEREVREDLPRDIKALRVMTESAIKELANRADHAAACINELEKDSEQLQEDVRSHQTVTGTMIGELDKRIDDAEGGVRKLGTVFGYLQDRVERLETPPDKQPGPEPPPEPCEKKPDPRSEYGCLMDRIRELEGQLQETTAALEQAQEANRNLREWQQRTQQAKQEARDTQDATLAELRDVAANLQETASQLVDERESLQQALHLLRFFLYDAEQDDDHQWTEDAEPEVLAAQQLMQKHRELFGPGCDDPEEDVDLVDEDPEDDGEEPEVPPAWTGPLREYREPPGNGRLRMQKRALCVAKLQQALRAERRRSRERAARDLRTIETLIQGLADAIGREATRPASAEEPSSEILEREADPWEHEQTELLELAWGLIANAHQGDWERASEDWRAAAERWRDRYCHGPKEGGEA